MSNHEDIVIDEWDIKLENMLVELKSCQQSNSLKTCSDCGKFFECELRKRYVKSVYESMNKGADSGFEF